MYFPDAQHLETHLNNDCNTLLRNLRTREDLHYELLQYNRRIVTRRRLEEDELFIKDEILQHSAMVGRVEGLEREMGGEEREVREKYEGTVVRFEEIIKLMGRVGARILETYQSSIDQCKAFDEELTEKYSRTKATLVKLINQKTEINLEEIINLVLSYSRSKLANELQKLKRLVTALESGDFSKLQEVYTFKQQRKVVSVLSVEKKKVSVDKVKVSSVGKEEKPPIKEQVKAQEKIRKQKQKVAVKLVHGLYSTMELSRQQFIEDICSNEREKANRLYNQIFVRNKLNYEQIKAFEAKAEDFHEKVRVFREMMERESRRIELAMRKQQKEEHVGHPQGKGAREQCVKVHSETLIVQDITSQQEIHSEKQILPNRYRIQSPKTKRNSRQLHQSFTNPVHAQQDFTHFKFDASGQEIYARTNRNKLPVIGTQNQSVSRASSLDHRVQPNKTKIFRHHPRAQIPEDSNNEEVFRNDKAHRGEKNLERTKLALKNIQLGARQQLMGKQRKRVQPSPMQYTFFIRRSNQKFYQGKLNALL